VTETRFSTDLGPLAVNAVTQIQEQGKKQRQTSEVGKGSRSNEANIALLMTEGAAVGGDVACVGKTLLRGWQRQRKTVLHALGQCCPPVLGELTIRSVWQWKLLLCKCCSTSASHTYFYIALSMGVQTAV